MGLFDETVEVIWPDGQAAPDVIETDDTVYVRPGAFKYRITVPREVWPADPGMTALFALSMREWLLDQGCERPFVVEVEEGTVVFSNDARLAAIITALAEGGIGGVARFLDLDDARQRHPSTNEETS